MAWALLSLGAALTSSCAEEPTGPAGRPEPITELPRALTSDEVELIGASNDFAFRMLSALSDDEPGSNLFFSPLSASMALGMTMNGAAGTTWEGMRTTLGFDGLTEEAINDGYRGLLDLLTELDSTVALEVGNSVWTRLDKVVDADFRARVEEHFDATLESVDFGDPATLDRINAWADEATRGKIEKMYDSLPGNVVVVLLNAVYFKGSWTTAFDPDQTRTATFTTSSGASVSVPLMGRELEAGWFQDEEVTGVDLPYGGGAFAFTAILPAEGTSVEVLLSGLDRARWDDWTSRLSASAVEVDVALPRFELSWEKKLNDILAGLGMEEAFQPGADFGRMFPGGFFIDEVKQKSVVEVNEEGTEAAAVTGVVGVESAGPFIRLERPFLFAIRERLSGTILFAGVLNDPSA